MKKVYKYGTNALIFFVLCSALALGGACVYFNDAFYGKSIYKFIMGTLIVATSIYVIFFCFLVKYIITEEGIRVEAGILLTPKELKWHEIYEVVYDPRAPGIRVYHITPKIPWGKTMHVSSFLSNSRDLLAEIAERAPQARIEEPIKRLIQEYKQSLK